MPRPQSLDDALKAEICERIVDGETVKQIAASDHMPSVRTIYQTLERDEAFAKAYAAARERQLERWEDQLIEIADDGTNDWMERRRDDGSKVELVNHEHIQRSKLRVDTRKWLMSKRLPRKYGDRLTHDGDGAGGPIKFQPVINVSLSGPRHPGSPEAGLGLGEPGD